MTQSKVSSPVLESFDETSVPWLPPSGHDGLHYMDYRILFVLFLPSHTFRDALKRLTFYYYLKINHNNNDADDFTIFITQPSVGFCCRTMSAL